MKSLTEQINIIKNKYKFWLGFSALICILATINIWGIFYYTNKHAIISGEYGLLDPFRKFFNREDLIVNIQPLRDYLHDIEVKDQNVSIYFELLNTGANIVVNKDGEFFPASLSKMPLAMSAVKKIERGEWHWNDELVIMSSDKDGRFGDLYKQPIGTQVTIEELVRRMLVDSDNTAYLMVLRNLEPDEFDKTQQALGLDEYFNKDGKISAKRYAVILRALYYASYLTPEDSEKLLEFMTRSKFNSYLGAGMSSNVKFSHKIGISSEEGIQLDAGIVYVPKRPYLLIMMVKSADQDYAQQYMKEVSEKIYNYVSEYSSKD